MTTNNKSYRSRNLTLALAGVTAVAFGAFGVIANIGATDTVYEIKGGKLTDFIATDKDNIAISSQRWDGKELVEDKLCVITYLADVADTYNCDVAKTGNYIIKIQDTRTDGTIQTTKYYGATGPVDITKGVTDLIEVEELGEKATGVYTPKNGAAIAKTPSHLVKFDSRGGSAVNSMFVENGKTIATTPASTLSGYRLDGWFTKVNGEGDKFIFTDTSDTDTDADTNTKVTTPTTLYAHWVQTYTISFDLNGGKLVSDTEANQKKLTATGVFEADAPKVKDIISGALKAADLKKDNAVFRGWFTAPTGGEQLLDTSETVIIKSTTYYAQWDGIFTVSFVDFFTPGQTIYENKNVVEGSTFAAAINPVPGAPTRIGYDFKGWYTTPTSPEGKIFGSVSGEKVASNTTFHARWISSSAATKTALPVLPPPYLPKDIEKGFSVEQTDAMRWMVNTGLSVDEVNKLYNPNNPVLRESMALFMYRMAGKPPVTVNKDIADIANLTKDQQEAISWVVKQGISVPGEDGKFNPFNPVLRESMALFMYRFAGSPVENFSEVKVNDLDGLTTEQANAIRWMVAYGISVPGDDDNFNPWNGVIRESMALFLQRTHNYLFN